MPTSAPTRVIQESSDNAGGVLVPEDTGAGLISRAAAGYQDDAENDDEACAGCVFFRYPHTCVKVAGVIDPEGTCNYFEGDDATRYYQPLRAFDESEPRDDKGRWTDGGGTGEANQTRWGGAESPVATARSQAWSAARIVPVRAALILPSDDGRPPTDDELARVRVAYRQMPPEFRQIAEHADAPVQVQVNNSPLGVQTFGGVHNGVGFVQLNPRVVNPPTGVFTGDVQTAILTHELQHATVDRPVIAANGGVWAVHDAILSAEFPLPTHFNEAGERITDMPEARADVEDAEFLAELGTDYEAGQTIAQHAAALAANVPVETVPHSGETGPSRARWTIPQATQAATLWRFFFDKALDAIPAHEKEPPAPPPAPAAPILRKITGSAFHGDPIPQTSAPTRQDVGKTGEQTVIAYLKQVEGAADARTAATDRNNFPVDVIYDHTLVEVKTGTIAAGKSAQQWRLTIGQPGKAETAAMAKLSPAALAAYNLDKQAAIVRRKAQALHAIEQQLGHPVTARTMTVILDSDRKVADIHSFAGWHQRIGWTSQQAKNGYLGTYSYADD